MSRLRSDQIPSRFEHMSRLDVINALLIEQQQSFHLKLTTLSDVWDIIEGLDIPMDVMSVLRETFANKVGVTRAQHANHIPMPEGPHWLAYDRLGKMANRLKPERDKKYAEYIASLPPEPEPEIKLEAVIKPKKSSGRKSSLYTPDDEMVLSIPDMKEDAYNG